MATAITLHPIIFYFMIFNMMLFLGLFCWVGWLWLKQYICDVIIFIDKSDRWEMVRDKITGSAIYNYKNKKYVLGKVPLNRKGKGLYIFSENIPKGMKINYNSSSWITSESLMTIINNKLIQTLVQTSISAIDKLILFGAIGGMLAGVASVIILLKTTGVF